MIGCIIAATLELWLAGVPQPAPEVSMKSARVGPSLNLDDVEALCVDELDGSVAAVAVLANER